MRPPPLGELFPEMGIIVKPCWCPFSLSLASSDPWEELTPQFLAIQDEAGGRGVHIQDGLCAAKYIISSLGSADQPHSPGENTKAQRGQVACPGSSHGWEAEEPDIWLRGAGGFWLLVPLLGCLLGFLKQGTPVAFGSESKLGADGELSLELLSYQTRRYAKHNPNSQTTSNSSTECKPFF